MTTSLTIDFDYAFRQLRKTSKSRVKGVERELREEYKRVVRELQGLLSDEYVKLAREDGTLTYAQLAGAGRDARFLSEVENAVSRGALSSLQIQRGVVDDIYRMSYESVVNAVNKETGQTLRDTFGFSSVDTETIRRAVQNPITGLKLNDRLEKNRKDIIYKAKQEITLGLMNGDRYETVARRIQDTFNGDYKKAVRVVRTETHRVQEAGRNDAAVEVGEELKKGTSGLWMTKTWRTMKDERVRPNRGIGKKPAKSGADHVMMDGQIVLADEKFTLSDGTETDAPGNSSVAGQDINCHCYVSYRLMTEEEYIAAGGNPKSFDKELKNEEESDRIELDEKLREIEESVRESPVEIGHTLDPQGRVLERVVGETHSVTPNQELLKGNIFTHNHPDGGTFSVGDILNFVSDDLLEVRASTPQGMIYVLRRGSSLPDKKFAAALQKTEFGSNLKAYRFANTQLIEKVKAGEYTLEYMRKNQQALIFEIVNHTMIDWLDENAALYGYVFEVLT